MMANITENSGDTPEWPKMFVQPKDNSNSVTFIKKLTNVAISTIMYLRDAIPLRNYDSEKFAILNLPVLKEKCQDEQAQILSTELLQAFEAFDVNYLRELVLCFYHGEYDIKNLKEFYMFEYLYARKEVTMDVMSQRESFKNIYEQTMDLIKSCIVVAEAMERLPKKFTVRLQLRYNSSAPPDGYQAPGSASISEFHRSLLNIQPHETCEMGSVSTSFHKLILICYTQGKAPASQFLQHAENEAATEMRDIGDASDGNQAPGSTSSSESDGSELEIDPHETCEVGSVSKLFQQPQLMDYTRAEASGSQVGSMSKPLHKPQLMDYTRAEASGSQVGSVSKPLQQPQLMDYTRAEASGSQIRSVNKPFHQPQLMDYTRAEASGSQWLQHDKNEAATEMRVIGEVEMELERVIDVRVQCACGLQDRDPDHAMLVCNKCNTLQHAMCYGRRRRSPRGIASHFCVRCAAAWGCPCADTRQLHLAPEKRKPYCLVRRALAWCSGRVRVSVPALMDRFTLRIVNASNVLELLIELGVLEDTDREIMSPRNIVPSKLAEVMRRHFEPEILDVTQRLEAESLALMAPMAPMRGPLARTLLSSEQSTLPETSQLGNTIEPQTRDSNDPQYRQVMELMWSLRNRQMNNNILQPGRHGREENH